MGSLGVELLLLLGPRVSAGTAVETRVGFRGGGATWRILLGLTLACTCHSCRPRSQSSIVL